MELDIKSNQALDRFLADFGDIFNDKREAKRFEDTIYGIIGAESPVVMQIAAHSPHRRENAFHTAKGIYRFLDAPEYEEQNLLLPIYEKTKEDLGHENEVVVVIDLSSWEKPYAKKMERLCKVEKKDKSGLTNGYVSVSTICIGEDIKRLGYFHLFANEPLSQNVEIRKAMEETNNLLPFGAKVIWVWDKGFDDGKNYEDIIGGDKEFIGRVYHNWKITVKGRKTKLLDWGRTLPVKTRFKASIFIWGKRREIEVEISFGRCKWNTHQVYLLWSRIIKGEGMNLEKIKGEDRGWWFLSNICIKDEESAFKVWRTYYKRWAIEDFFKFVKDGFEGERFQVLGFEAIQKLVGMIVIASAFIYELGATSNIPFVNMFLFLGGWDGRSKPGKEIVKRGLSMVITTILVITYMREHNMEDFIDRLGRVKDILF